MHELAFKHLQKDPVLKKAMADVDLPHIEETSNQVFFALLRSICSQQLSVKAAATIFGRFLDLFPNQEPTADTLLSLSIDDLRAVGLSRQKANYMHNVAEFDLEHKMDRKDYSMMENEEIVALLTQIKGVGEWTVQMLMMFTLGRPDVLPVLDLGIQQGIQRMYKLESTGKELKKDMERIAEPWRPYRTLACLVVWRWKDQ